MYQSPALGACQTTDECVTPIRVRASPANHVACVAVPARYTQRRSLLIHHHGVSPQVDADTSRRPLADGYLWPAALLSARRRRAKRVSPLIQMATDSDVGAPVERHGVSCQRPSDSSRYATNHLSVAPWPAERARHWLMKRVAAILPSAV